MNLKNIHPWCKNNLYQYEVFFYLAQWQPTRIDAILYTKGFTFQSHVTFAKDSFYTISVGEIALLLPNSYSN